MIRQFRGGAAMINLENRTFICSVVSYDIADYSAKSVEVQIRIKEQLNRFTTEAIKDIAVNDRILLDIGDGAVICFLGDPEDALFVAMSLRDAILNADDQFTDDPLLVRFGIDLGPVKLVNDINNKKYISGDSVNVGQRVMVLAKPGQILVSRPYYDIVSSLSQEYANLFKYQGIRTDKHAWKHEIYSILRTSDQEKAIASTESSRDNAAQISDRNGIAIFEVLTTPPDSVPDLEENSKNSNLGPSTVSLKLPFWREAKRTAFSGVFLAIFLAVILSFVMHRNLGGNGIQPDKVAISTETQLKSSEESPSKITASAENVSLELPELIQPVSPVSDTIIQHDSQDKSPTENAQLTKTASSVQTLQINPVPSVPKLTIQFAITPWGEVYVDGTRKGASPPLTSVSVSPGKHKIEIKNTSFPPYSKTHKIMPNEKLKISHKF
jgi:class 3 adenylate cyclase